MNLTILQPASFNSSSSLVDDINLIDVTSYDLRREIERRASFYDNAWINPFINADDLALVGFYYYKKPDVVKCTFCDIAIKEFEEGDEAFLEHKKWSPNCPLLLRRKLNPFC